MRANVRQQSAQEHRVAKWTRYVLGITCAALVLGLASATSLEELLAYFAVTVTSLAPAALWLWAGAPGIPVWPVSASLYYIYFAVPLVRSNLVDTGVFGYTGDEILSAGFTVSLYLVSGTLAWWAIISSRKRRSVREAPELISRSVLARVVYCGLGLGVFYFLLLYSPFFAFMGIFIGVIRSVCFTATLIACFLLGYGRAIGILRDAQFMIGMTLLGIIVIFSVATFFLIGGLMFCLTAVVGYSITAKKVPWKTVAAVVLVAGILHAGKGEMRQRYWVGMLAYDPTISVAQMPTRMFEWGTVGVQQLMDNEKSVSVIDRAALFHLLLRVQRIAPDVVPYLAGESYLLFPTMLIPRFVEAGKTSSQAAMRLLNVRFGIQTDQAANFTSIGWGPVLEAYANFGNIGAVFIGLLLGLFAGILTRVSDRQLPTSLPSLVAIAGLVTMINLESDFSYLMVNFFQACIALLMFYVAMHPFMTGKKRRRRAITASSAIMPTRLDAPRIDAAR